MDRSLCHWQVRLEPGRAKRRSGARGRIGIGIRNRSRVRGRHNLVIIRRRRCFKPRVTLVARNQSVIAQIVET